MAEIASCWFSPGFPPVGFCWGEAEARTGPAVEDVGRSGLARGAVGSLLAMEVGTEISRLELWLGWTGGSHLEKSAVPWKFEDWEPD